MIFLKFKEAKTANQKIYKIIPVLLLIPSLCFAADNALQAENSIPSAVTTLSSPLRTLLSQEMQQLQKGMMEIQPLYISGRWAEIAPIAKTMEDSYVLKKSLSKDQVHELHSKLPNEFIELDQQFHYLSGELAHAAKTQKPRLVGFYYAKMSETCLNCHTKFATHRFPALISKALKHDH